MPFQFLTKDNIFDKYSDSKTYTDKLTQPFPEFERIARNRPSDSIDDKLPKVTDGTTASIIRKTPKRVVQQLPTGVVESDADEDWLPVVAQFIYTNKILPYANEDYDLIQKCWNNIENGLTFGFGASYSPFINHDGYFCPDMVLPYWGDIYIQPGKKSGYSSNYIFIRSWWQKEDVEALIDKEKKLSSKAKGRGDAYEPTWDTEALQAVLTATTSKDEQGTTPSEREKGVNSSPIEIITGFQTGVGANFYTFNKESKKILRTKKNKDPRGKMPIDWLYGDIDGSNPFGRGIVELIGGIQNLIDSDMQMYQFNRALLLAPPVIKRGSFPKTRIVYAPNAIIDVGTDAQAAVEPLKIDSTALSNYPDLYGLLKSQALNLVSSPDTSISSEVGNPGFGKTPTAINQQKATISVDDNYVRKMFEAWFQNWSETAINLFFAERTGTEILQLDDDTAMKLRKLAEEGKFQLEGVDANGNPFQILNDKNQLLINYDSATPALKFCVDASTSKMKDDSDQLTALQGILKTLEGSQVLQAIVPPEKVAGVYNAIVAVSGVEDPEDLSIDMEKFQQMQEQAQQQEQQPQQPTEQPKPAVNYKDAPEDVKRQMEASDGYQPSQEVSPVQQQNDLKQQELEQNQANTEMDQASQFIQHLQTLGVPDDALELAAQALQAGASPDEVMQVIGAVNARG